MSTKTLLIVLLPCLLQQQCLGRNEESSTLAQLDDCTCLGYNQIFECTVFGGGFTYWQGTAFSDCQRNEIQLRHSEYNTGPHQATGDCNGGKIVAKSIGVSGNCYTSQLNVSIEQEIMNETINCIHSDTQHVTTTIGQIVLSLTQVPYPPPSNVRVEAIERNGIVFAWNKTTSVRCSSIQYVITTVNCGVCPNTTTNTNITCVQFSVLSNRTCMFAVQTEICGYLVGPRSDYVIINLFVPSPPKFKLRLHYSSPKYTAIETVFPVAQNMTISDNIDGSPISYNITYSDFNSGRVCSTFVIPAATCRDRMCRHKSQIASPCSPNEDVSMTILSTNILGSGPSSQPVIFSLTAASDDYSAVTNSTLGGSEITCEPLVTQIAAILSALLIIIVVIIVMVIVTFTVVTIKLLRDKANLKQAIKTLSSEQDVRKTGKEQATCSGDYEDVDTYKASDMDINENAAYSTVTDL